MIEKTYNYFNKVMENVDSLEIINGDDEKKFFETFSKKMREIEPIVEKKYGGKQNSK
jgi:hypothetical protein